MRKPTYVICDEKGNAIKNSEEVLTSLWGSAYLYNSILNRLENNHIGKIVMFHIYMNGKKYNIFRKGIRE